MVKTLEVYVLDDYDIVALQNLLTAYKSVASQEEGFIDVVKEIVKVVQTHKIMISEVNEMIFKNFIGACQNGVQLGENEVKLWTQIRNMTLSFSCRWSTLANFSQPAP